MYISAVVTCDSDLVAYGYLYDLEDNGRCRVMRLGNLKNHSKFDLNGWTQERILLM